MPHILHAPPRDSLASSNVLSLSLSHPFGRAALTVGLCAVVALGLGLTVPGVVVVAAACVSAGINVRRGFLDLAGGRQVPPTSGPRQGSRSATPSAPGPAARPPDGAAGLAAAVAVAGTAAAVGLLLTFYVPGMREAGRDVDDMIVILALPAVAMALPFAMLAFIRGRIILLIAGGVLAWTLIGAAIELFDGPPDGEGESLLVFAVVIVLNFLTSVTALVVSVASRAARRPSPRS